MISVFGLRLGKVLLGVNVLGILDGNGVGITLKSKSY